MTGLCFSAHPVISSKRLRTGGSGRKGDQSLPSKTGSQEGGRSVASSRHRPAHVASHTAHRLPDPADNSKSCAEKNVVIWKFFTLVQFRYVTLHCLCVHFKPDNLLRSRLSSIYISSKFISLCTCVIFLAPSVVHAALVLKVTKTPRVLGGRKICDALKVGRYPVHLVCLPF